MGREKNAVPWVLTGVLWFSFGVACLAQSRPSQDLIGDYVAKSALRRGERLKEINSSIVSTRKRLTAMRRGKIDPSSAGTTIGSGPRGTDTFRFRTADVKQLSLDEAEADIVRLETSLDEIRRGVCIVTADLPKDKLEVGMIGTLWVNGVRVLQVLDARNVLAETRLHYMTVEVRGNRAIPTQESRPLLVWFTNVDTGRMTDGTLAEIDDVLWVSGTKQYNTAGGGSKTVLQLTAVDLSDELGEAMAAAAAESTTEAHPGKPTAEWRMWTDASGSYKTEARMNQYMGGVAHLEKRDGVVVKIPLDKLSNADQEYIRNRR